jgi:hypothetical protein
MPSLDDRIRAARPQVDVPPTRGFTAPPFAPALARSTSPAPRNRPRLALQAALMVVLLVVAVIVAATVTRSGNPHRPGSTTTPTTPTTPTVTTAAEPDWEGVGKAIAKYEPGSALTRTFEIRPGVWIGIIDAGAQYCVAHSANSPAGDSCRLEKLAIRSPQSGVPGHGWSSSKLDHLAKPWENIIDVPGGGRFDPYRYLAFDPSDQIGHVGRDVTVRLVYEDGTNNAIPLTEHWFAFPNVDTAHRQVGRRPVRLEAVIAGTPVTTMALSPLAFTDPSVVAGWRTPASDGSAVQDALVAALDRPAMADQGGSFARSQVETAKAHQAGTIDAGHGSQRVIVAPTIGGGICVVVEPGSTGSDGVAWFSDARLLGVENNLQFGRISPSFAVQLDPKRPSEAAFIVARDYLHGAVKVTAQTEDGATLEAQAITDDYFFLAYAHHTKAGTRPTRWTATTVDGNEIAQGTIGADLQRRLRRPTGGTELSGSSAQTWFSLAGKP